MMEAIGNEKNNYTFSRKDGLFINFDVVFHVVLYWPLMGLGIWCGISHPNICTLILSFLSGISLFVSCLEIYSRWQVFQYDKDTTLSINIGQQGFTYKHHDKVMDFNSSDIDEWCWDRSTFDPVNTTLAEIAEIRLKDGQEIIVTNGIGPIVDFFLENWEELGMPKGERSSKPLVSYMKEIEMQQ